jgi:NitT/TauT family transport system permease protein
MGILQSNISGIITGFILGGLIGCALAGLGFGEKLLGMILKPLQLILGKLPEITLILPLFFHNNPDITFIVCLVATAGFFYGSVYKALEGTDSKLLEMAHIFRMPVDRQMQYIFLPQVLAELKHSALIGVVRCLVIGVASGVICSLFK